MEITIALGQMAIALGRPDLNETTARTLVTQAAERGADLVMLPELWGTGYDLGQASRYAAPLDGGPFAWMAALAREHHLYIVGTALEDNPTGLPFNTAAILGPAGQLVGAYRKVHLFPPLGEAEHMAPGRDLPIFDLPWGRTALAICYDLRFPELWRHVTIAGAQLILIPAEWPLRRVEHWQLLLRARAVENQLFVSGCNRAGLDTDGEFGGHSAVIDPWGRVVAEAGSEAGLVFATVDLEEVTRTRRLFPVLNHRRPDVYG